LRGTFHAKPRKKESIFQTRIHLFASKDTRLQEGLETFEKYPCVRRLNASNTPLAEKTFDPPTEDSSGGLA